MLGNTKAQLRRLRQDGRGVTLVELLMVTAVAGLLVVSVMSVTFVFYGDIIRGNQQARLAVESQNVLRNIVEELRLSSGIRANNAVTDSNAPGGTWTTSNENLILIISTPVLNTSNDFVIDPVTGSPYQNEIVYFANGGTLYKRTLANPSAIGNTLKTTCPAASASPTCSPDIKMSENFETMHFIFYDQDDDITTTLSDAKSIELTIEMLRRSFGQIIEFDNRIRITLRNTVL